MQGPIDIDADEFAEARMIMWERLAAEFDDDRPQPFAGVDWSSYKVDVPEGRSGPWSIARVDCGNTSPTAAVAMLRGEPFEPGRYTVLSHVKRGTIMSDCPPEVAGCLEFLERARGRVLISGLGLGVVVKQLLARDDVTSVDVVERDPHVIKMVAPHYANTRLHVHHGDALTYRFPPGTTWDCAWHDIWDQIRAENLPDMHRLHRRYGGRVGWQMSWARAECEALRARGKHGPFGVGKARHGGAVCRVAEWA